MLSFKELKKLMIDKNITFKKVIEKDGRSRQYLTKECNAGNQKVLQKLFDIVYNFFDY